MTDISILNIYDPDLRDKVVVIQDMGFVTVYVGRGSRYGNPFKIGEHGTRQEVIRLYEEWLDERPHLVERLDRPNLGGLRCYCAPLPCPAEIIRDRIIRRRMETKNG